MLFRKQIVSMRTFLAMAVAVAFSMSAPGTASAQNTNVPPLLVPYTINTIAGNPQFLLKTTTIPAGYFGEGVAAVPTLANQNNTAVLETPYAIAVDSVGNVYITDSGNYIIREVNAQTGLINTIAGVVPKGCSGYSCTVRVSGCADGVPAIGAPIGAHAAGIAVDAYGNVYFDDSTTATVSVIYRAGAQVASFIGMVDPGGIAKSGGSAQVGYIYHVAGTINLSTCAGTPGNVDNVPAFEDSSNPPAAPGGQLNGPTLLTLDSAGNIYVADIKNLTVRVINTQATTQTFFQYAVPPGFVRSITNCSPALTTACPSASTTTTANTGINGPVNGLVYNTQYKAAEVDAYGNVYQLNGTGGGTGPPGIYGAAAYAGGAPLTNLLTATAPGLASSYPGELPLTYGNSYIILGDPAISSPLTAGIVDIIVTQNEGSFMIRATSLRPDNFGTFWYLDNHYPELERVDQYTGLGTFVVKGSATNPTRATANIAPLNNNPASFSNPYFCVYGSTSSKIPWTQGPITYDPQGDGCPTTVASIAGGNYQTVSDGLGNIYVGDGNEELERILTNGNAFAPTAVGTPVTQPIQVHFNSSNPPALGGGVPAAAASTNTTTAFSIAPGISDFTIDTTDPEFPMGSLVGLGTEAQTTTTPNFQMWSGLPTCTQLGQAPIATTVTDYDCLVYVTFNPTAPGVRQSQLKVTTANGSIYYISLSGNGNGGQLAIDGGAPTTVPITGLGSSSSPTVGGVAVSQSGTLYVADPANNRIVVVPAGGGTQSNLTFTGVTPATLSGPMGVALDSAANVYVSDTGNNRILEITPSITGTGPGVATVLGNYYWIAGTNGILAPPGTTVPSGVGAPPPPMTSTTPPPQYAFNAPQGIAVDKWNNVYIADTGNKAIVEIPSNHVLGGAVPLLNYPGAPTFINPVGVAVDSLGNIYVADTKNPSSQIVELPPGGGDLVTIQGSQFSNLLGSGLRSPSGVAVDGAGNLYVSDIGNNDVVEIPSASGPGSTPFVINLTNVNAGGTALTTLAGPGGVALDPNGNLYIADAGNRKVLFDNRQNPIIQFGNVPQYQTSPAQPICPNTTLSDGSNIGVSGTCPLTVTNTGNQAVSLQAMLTAVSGTSNTAFAVTNNCSGTSLAPGLTCNIFATFNPTMNNNQSENVSVNGTQSLTLMANATGEQPLVNIALAATYSSGTTPTAGATATISATVTQPHLVGVTPSGTVTFTYVIDAANKNLNSCGTGGTQTVPLSGGVATFTLPVLVQGVQYTVTANYNGDPLNTATAASPLLVSVPGIPVTATVTSTATQLTFTYGGKPPVPVGTLNVTLPAGITASFGSAATATTPTGSYPVIVSFSGAGSCAYGFPPSVYSTGGSAFVTETPAPLTYTIPNFTSQYGAANISYGANAVIVGAVNGDGFGATFIPPQSSILNVGTYSVTPTVVGADVSDYTVTAHPSALIITQAPTAVSVTAAKTAVLNTPAGVAAATYSLSVATTVASGKGTPSGGITVVDNFNAVTAAAGSTPAASGTATATPTFAATPPPPIPNVPPNGFALGLPITIADSTSGAVIYYTIDGSTPTAQSLLYTAPVTVTGTQVLSAIAVAPGDNPSVVVHLVFLAAGVASYTPADTTPGLHQYSFIYDGDSNFQTSQVVPATGAAPCTGAAVALNCLLVDNPDFFLTSNTGTVAINPGVVPSGNGLLSAPGQNSAFPETAVMLVTAVNGFVGSVSLSCQTPNPSYETCFMTPVSVCFASSSTPACTNTATSAASVVAISTPASLPLGFKTSQVQTSATKTVLAFLPLGFLAFCVRRRRRLSNALWMLIGVVAIGAVITGCGGNQVAFYTPIPTGSQGVTVTATYVGNGTNQPAASRQFVVPILID
jgi:sugar lactone lactonase YvrE